MLLLVPSIQLSSILAAASSTSRIGSVCFNQRSWCKCWSLRAATVPQEAEIPELPTRTSGYKDDRIVVHPVWPEGARKSQTIREVGQDLIRLYDKGLRVFDMGLAPDTVSSESTTPPLSRAVRHLITQVGTADLEFAVHWSPKGAISNRAATRAVESRMLELGVDHLNLVLLEWPSTESLTVDRRWVADALAQLSELKRQGKVLDLGLVGDDPRVEAIASSSGARIACNEVRRSILFTAHQGLKDEECIAGDANRKLLVHGFLEGGLMSEKWLGRRERDAALVAQTNQNLAFALRVLRQREIEWPFLQKVLERCVDVARKHSMGIEEVAFLWAYHQRAVGSLKLPVLLHGRGTEMDMGPDSTITIAQNTRLRSLDNDDIGYLNNHNKESSAS